MRSLTRRAHLAAALGAALFVGCVSRGGFDRLELVVAGDEDALDADGLDDLSADGDPTDGGTDDDADDDGGADGDDDGDGGADGDDDGDATVDDGDPVACVPTEFADGMAARLVLGQDDFAANLANRGATPTANTLSTPLGIAVHAGKLYVADNGNNRVLVWNTLPTTSGQPADVVLGHDSFISGDPVSTGAGFAGPQGLAVTDGWLAVAEWTNNRVALWNLANLTGAAVVLGQPNDTTTTPNTGGIGAATMQNPTGVAWGAQGELVVNDAGNNRVLIFAGLVVYASGMDASVVLGQSDFLTNTAGTAAGSLSFPLGATAVGAGLVVVDSYNDRIALYNTLPTTSGQVPDLLWGGWGYSATQLNSPVGAWSDGSRLWVADRGSDRVLVFHSGPPTSSSTPADHVLGQATFGTSDHNQCSCTTARADTLWGAHFVAWDGCRLYVSDTQNHRVLVY